MKVLVIGKGGREHALCWKLAKDGHEVLALPGNPGVAAQAELLAGASDAGAIVTHCRQHQVDLVVVGPEAPLCAGLCDDLRAAGIPAFGPGADGAQLEGSKVFSKEFFTRHGLRTADYVVCGDASEIDAAMAKLAGVELVVKADGLAAGKGVVVCDSREMAREAAASMLAGEFGEAGERVVIEQRIRGREVSVLAITDGNEFLILPQAEDHKAIFDGDRGPNTGGMGTVCPASWVAEDFIDRVSQEFFAPTVAGLRAEGIDYRGVLYAGFMIDASGTPWILEYNCRFGDPETQAVVPRIAEDLGALFFSAATASLSQRSIALHDNAAVCVILASAGYPRSSTSGEVITGVPAATDEVVVFHAGTAIQDETLVTAGGRVLGVTGIAQNTSEARAVAYAAAKRIEFSGKQMRNDIGQRGD